jgi:putative ABC transport system ATP-binding protein
MEVANAVLPATDAITAGGVGAAGVAAPVFSMRGVSKVYGTDEAQVHALRDVSLEIGRGEFVVLLGASGSGKSTLLNILGGLDLPSSGEVRFGDLTLSGAGEAELTRYRREHVGFVFQFYNLIPSLTVFENIALVTDIALHPMPIDEALASTTTLGAARCRWSAWPRRWRWW